MARRGLDQEDGVAAGRKICRYITLEGRRVHYYKFLKTTLRLCEGWDYDVDATRIYLLDTLNAALNDGEISGGEWKELFNQFKGLHRVYFQEKRARMKRLVPEAFK
jgi:hypothetical protein